MPQRGGRVAARQNGAAVGLDRAQRWWCSGRNVCARSGTRRRRLVGVPGALELRQAPQMSPMPLGRQLTAGQPTEPLGSCQEASEKLLQNMRKMRVSGRSCTRRRRGQATKVVSERRNTSSSGGTARRISPPRSSTAARRQCESPACGGRQGPRNRQGCRPTPPAAPPKPTSPAAKSGLRRDAQLRNTEVCQPSAREAAAGCSLAAVHAVALQGKETRAAQRAAGLRRLLCLLHQETTAAACPLPPATTRQRPSLPPGSCLAPPGISSAVSSTKNSTRTGWDLFCCFQQLQVRHDTSDMWWAARACTRQCTPYLHQVHIGVWEAGRRAARQQLVRGVQALGGAAQAAGSRTRWRPTLPTRQALMTNPKAVDGCTHWSRSGGRRSRRRSPQPGRTWRIGGTWSGFRERARGWASGGGKGQPPPGQAARAALALAARRRPSAAPHGPVGAPRASPER